MASVQDIIDGSPIAAAPGEELPTAERIMRHIVFLPIDAPMPDRELQRLGKAVGRFGRPIEDLTSKPKIQESFSVFPRNSDANVSF